MDSGVGSKFGADLTVWVAPWARLMRGVEWGQGIFACGAGFLLPLKYLVKLPAILYSLDSQGSCE